MRRLDRATVPAPPCLASYKHGAQNWSAVTSEHKKEIRTRLEQLQGKRCAYCEACLDAFGHHIEHFRRKSRFPALTFAWTNLLWSCDCIDHCGHYKDHRAGHYDPNDLVDPAVDDPDQFFQFFSDGSIRIRLPLNPAEQHRANETLRVLNLDSEHGPLRHMRRAYCAGYVTLGAEIAKLAAASSPEEWQPFLDDELSRAQELPFATAIRHTLTPA